jgi:hypothetical protein
MLPDRGNHVNNVVLLFFANLFRSQLVRFRAVPLAIDQEPGKCNNEPGWKSAFECQSAVETT